MRKYKTEYAVVNVFSDAGTSERKEKINKAIRALCILDIEKSTELDYNIGDVAKAAFPTLPKEEHLQNEH